MLVAVPDSIRVGALAVLLAGAAAFAVSVRGGDALVAQADLAPAQVGTELRPPAVLVARGHASFANHKVALPEVSTNLASEACFAPNAGLLRCESHLLKGESFQLKLSGLLVNEGQLIPQMIALSPYCPLLPFGALKVGGESSERLKCGLALGGIGTLTLAFGGVRLNASLPGELSVGIWRRTTLHAATHDKGDEDNFTHTHTLHQPPDRAHAHARTVRAPYPKGAGGGDRASPDDPCKGAGLMPTVAGSPLAAIDLRHPREAERLAGLCLSRCA